MTVTTDLTVMKSCLQVGDYFPKFLDMLESDPFLRLAMPWGKISILDGHDRAHSNDGPILWARPGEQMVPTADMPKSPFKQQRKRCLWFTATCKIQHLCIASKPNSIHNDYKNLLLEKVVVYASIPT
jgi:hypothetical protein